MALTDTIRPVRATAKRDVPPEVPVEERIVDAALRCMARWGLAKTTVDDVARDAGCSRATLYRAFPGGKDTLLTELLGREVSRFFDQLDVRLSETPDDLESLVAEAFSFALGHLRGHEALATMLAQEPEVILPLLARGQLDALLATVGARLGPHLEPHLGAAQVPLAAELLTRLVLSYALRPSAVLDPSDPDDLRRLVRAFVVPGLRNLQGAS
jgi:AcrR family transcriptional regulator